MGIKNNLISGFCASCGGVLTKVAFGFGSDGTVDTAFMPIIKDIISQDTYSFKLLGVINILGYTIPAFTLNYLIKMAIHILFMCMGITTSTLMYTYYVKSMQENGAGKATVYNFAVNYLGSIDCLMFRMRLCVPGNLFLNLFFCSSNNNFYEAFGRSG